MLAKLRDVLDYKMTIAELIGLAIMLGVPYLALGLGWSLTHTTHLRQLHGADLVVSFLGSIVSWPVLVFSNVCMT